MQIPNAHETGSRRAAKAGLAANLFLLIGWLSFVLGCIGVLLPLLPTTPFMILAAYCFSRGSERCHRWLLGLKTFGPMIRDWEEHGVIRRRAKQTATVFLLLLPALPLYLEDFPLYLKAALVITVICVLAFIWSRPSSE